MKTNSAVLFIGIITILVPGYAQASESSHQSSKKNSSLKLSLKKLSIKTDSPPASPRTRAKNHNKKEQERYKDEKKRYDFQKATHEEFGSMGGMFSNPSTPREPDLWPTPGTSPASTPREFTITAGNQAENMPASYDTDDDLYRTPEEHSPRIKQNPIEQLDPHDMVKLIKWETEIPLSDTMCFYQGNLSEHKKLTMVTILANKDQEISPQVVAHMIGKNDTMNFDTHTKD